MQQNNHANGTVRHRKEQIRRGDDGEGTEMVRCQILEGDVARVGISLLLCG